MTSTSWWRPCPTPIATSAVWLPSAYGRAPFGLEYLVYLVALPTAGITLPAWFLYEVTTANLTSVTDDRGRGLKRWYLVTTAILTVVATVPMFAVRGRDHGAALMFGISGLMTFVIFCAFLPPPSSSRKKLSA